MVDFILRSEGRDPWYVSDPETKYKCTEQSDGSYFCERLDKTIHNPKRRFIMTASVKDHSGSQLVRVELPGGRKCARLDLETLPLPTS